MQSYICSTTPTFNVREQIRYTQYFQPLLSQQSVATDTAMSDDCFQVKLTSNGASHRVAANESIVDVLRNNGIDL